MKQLLILLAMLAIGQHAIGKYGYKVDINFSQPLQDSVVYLAKYYAKALPTIFKVDSVIVRGEDKITFESKDSILGGMYLVMFNHNKRFFELILDNGSTFEMTLNDSQTEGVVSPKNIAVKGSSENERYIDYKIYLDDFSKHQKSIITDGLAKAKNKEDSNKIYTIAKEEAKKLYNYRSNYVTKHKGTFLANVMNVLAGTPLPEGIHYLEDGKTVDSLFEYNFIKKHYWDKFNFADARLIHTPLFETKLEEYFKNWVYQIPDSANKEIDFIINKAAISKDFYKYTIQWLTKNYLNTKNMGMDECFIHIVENYHMKDKVFWLDSAEIAWYEERARKIAPTVLGNIGQDMVLQDVWTLKDVNIYSVDATYTLLLFWDPECGTCQKEVPAIDSMYNTVLKQKGLKVFSMPHAPNQETIQNFIKKNLSNDWTHAIDAHNLMERNSKYDVYSFPKLILLDKDKKILAKGLTHENLLDVIDWIEKRKQ